MPKRVIVLVLFMVSVASAYRGGLLTCLGSVQQLQELRCVSLWFSPQDGLDDGPEQTI